jgi:hypothetical protein
MAVCFQLQHRDLAPSYDGSVGKIAACHNIESHHACWMTQPSEDGTPSCCNFSKTAMSE